MIAEITKLQLNRIKKRVEAAHSVPSVYTQAVIDQIVARCQGVESGGRMIDAIVINIMLLDAPSKFVRRRITRMPVAKVALDEAGDEFTSLLSG